ncbi:hypothetical protein Tco_0161590 [Tanacetum coccineum]
MPVQTRRQLAADPEMCMFALTVSIVEPKNIKEAMADSAWIEAMQDELHQFDRLNVWELVDKPFGKMVIKLKWLWKNKKDEDQSVIRNKARLVAKGLLNANCKKALNLLKKGLLVQGEAKTTSKRSVSRQTDHLKMEMEMEIPSVKASANSDIIFFFTSAQDGNKLLDDERLSLADDLKKAHDQNQNKSK